MGAGLSRQRQAATSIICAGNRVYSTSQQTPYVRFAMHKPILQLTLVLICATAGPTFGQNDGMIHLPPMVQQGPNTTNIPVRSQEEADKERAKRANEMLQIEIRRDTDKLAQLSAELKDSIDKTNQGILPVDTLKKAEQIEKLAKSVKSKLKQSDRENLRVSGVPIGLIGGSPVSAGTMPISFCRASVCSRNAS